MPLTRRNELTTGKNARMCGPKTDIKAKAGQSKDKNENVKPKIIIKENGRPKAGMKEKAEPRVAIKARVESKVELKKKFGQNMRIKEKVDLKVENKTRIAPKVGIKENCSPKKKIEEKGPKVEVKERVQPKVGIKEKVGPKAGIKAKKEPKVDIKANVRSNVQGKEKVMATFGLKEKVLPKHGNKEPIGPKVGENAEVKEKSVPVKRNKETDDIAPARQKKKVPPTWTKDDLNINIKELEEITENQTSYIQLQESMIQSNEELLNKMKHEQDEQPKILYKYHKEVGRLGEETGGYETEIKYYNSLAVHSDINNNMAQETFDDAMKYAKSLTKTLSILEGKTGRLHDHQDVNECKHAALFLQDERDKEDYLMAKMIWYQDQLQKCHGRIYESDEDDSPDLTIKTVLQLPAVKEHDDPFGNGKCILPEIKRQEILRNASHDMVKKDSPRPFKLPVIPAIAINCQSEKMKVREPKPTDELKLTLPSIGATQNTVSERRHVPSPPLTPRVTSKRWSFFRRK